VKNKHSLVHHGRVARGYLILSLAKRARASGKQPTSVREPKIDSSLRVNSKPGRLTRTPLATSPTMTIRPPAATRSTVDWITPGLPVASITTGAPSPPVCPKTFSINFSLASSVSAPRRFAISRRELTTSVATTRAPRSKATSMMASPIGPQPSTST
jgi:hypothetical protein